LCHNAMSKKSLQCTPGVAANMVDEPAIC